MQHLVVHTDADLVGVAGLIVLGLSALAATRCGAASPDPPQLDPVEWRVPVEIWRRIDRNAPLDEARGYV